MNLKSMTAAVLALAAWMMCTSGARADTVLYDGTGFVVGTQSFVQSFDLSSPGTLTVTLTNVAWPDQLASLNMLLGSASGAIGPEMGAGTSSFSVTAGDVFAQWFGTAQGPLDAGVFSMKIDFTPAGQAAVPLPASLALLVSGLALLAWYRRRPDVGHPGTASREGEASLAPSGVDLWQTHGAHSAR
jgi:hypothetical protein